MSVDLDLCWQNRGLRLAIELRQTPQMQGGQRQMRGNGRVVIGAKGQVELGPNAVQMMLAVAGGLHAVVPSAAPPGL